MSFTFYAEDNEFAAATGSNVNNGDGTSTFDYPPTSTMNLVITSSADDDDPRLFEVGEVYSLSFQGNGGTTISEATVIRSDPLSGNEGAIVFEGLNPEGELVQVVWSPNFDLEGWYYDNFNAGGSPGFYTTDRNAQTYSYACFTDGTLIRTAGGDVPVEALTPGDLLQTKDNGMQPLLWHTASRVPGLGRAAPVAVRPEVFRAPRTLTLSAQHRVLLDCAQVELNFGVPEMITPVKSLIDGIRVTRANAGMMRYHHLLLERHELILADGVWCESLLLGDRMNETLGPDALSEFQAAVGIDYPLRRVMKPVRPILRVSDFAVLRDGYGLEVRDVSRAVPSFFMVS